MKFDKDILHGQIISILDELTFKDTKFYKWSSILFNDIGYSFDIKYRYILKQLIIKLFFGYFKIQKNDYNLEKIMLFTIKYNRNDHDGYWEKFKKISGVQYEIELKYNENGIRLNDKILPDTINFMKIFCSLNRINLLKSRIWISIQILNAQNIIKELERIDAKCKSVIMFYDGGFEGNIVSQFYKQQGATTITLQHGQCLYRDKNHDRINQSVILNFISDYCICKGEFAKKQFIKAGFDESRLLALGNLDFVDGLNEGIITDDEKKVFCIFLDTPSYPFYKESTKQLIDVANSFCEKFNFIYFIKPHPADKEKSYLESIDRKYCKEILDSNHSLEEIGEKNDFSIFHASAIYADLLLRNIKAYKLETEIDFDIVLDEFDTFTSIDELHEKNEIWINTDVSKKYAFFKEQNELYSNPYDVKRRYQDFIKSLDD